jgi:hypothetical protein
MTDRDEVEKLRILIPHWIDHNKEHAEEFRSWSSKAGNVAAKIEAAAARMEAVNDVLQEALLQLGGPIEFVPDHVDS